MATGLRTDREAAQRANRVRWPPDRIPARVTVRLDDLPPDVQRLVLLMVRGAQEEADKARAAREEADRASGPAS